MPALTRVPRVYKYTKVRHLNGFTFYEHQPSIVGFNYQLFVNVLNLYAIIELVQNSVPPLNTGSSEGSHIIDLAIHAQSAINTEYPAYTSILYRLRLSTDLESKLQVQDPEVCCYWGL